MSDEVEPLLDGARRSVLPVTQSQASAQPNEAILTCSNDSVMPDDNSGSVEITIPASARPNTLMPPGYTNAEATEIWRNNLLKLIVLCFVAACVEAGIAWLYSDKMPLVCIVLFTGAVPMLGLSCAYFILRVRGLDPTWSLVSKVLRCMDLAYRAHMAAGVNLAVYAGSFVLTDGSALRDYPPSSFHILYCLCAAAIAQRWLRGAARQLLVRMASSVHGASAVRMLQLLRCLAASRAAASFH